MDVTNVVEQPRRSGRTDGPELQVPAAPREAAAGRGQRRAVGQAAGERALAKQFNVNAKTLSKALTDLAAEGLLDRSIGRGTYVKGSAPAQGNDRKWLILCDPEQLGWETIQLIRAAHPAVEVVTDVSALRPSFLNGFQAVIDLASAARPRRSSASWSSATCRWWWWARSPGRSRPTRCCSTGRWPCAWPGRDLVLGGHRRLAAVEPKGSTVVASNAAVDGRPVRGRRHGRRLLPGQDVPAMVANGITAFVCQSVDWAEQVARAAGPGSAGPCPARCRSAAMGSSTADVQPVSGYFLHRSEKVNAIVRPAERHPGVPADHPLAGRPAGRSGHDRGGRHRAGDGARPGPRRRPAVRRAGNRD